MHPASIFMMVSGKTNPQIISTNGWTGYFEIIADWDKALAGFEYTVQGAWADSVTGKLNLSQARNVTLPAPEPQPKVACCYAYATYKYGPYNTYYYNPIRRYGY